MAFEELLKSTGEWFAQPGPLDGTVVSTRVRFARNFEGRKFPHHASATEQREIVETIQRAILTEPALSHLAFIRLNEVSSLDRQFPSDISSPPSTRPVWGKGPSLSMRPWALVS